MTQIKKKIRVLPSYFIKKVELSIPNLKRISNFRHTKKILTRFIELDSKDFNYDVVSIVFCGGTELMGYYDSEIKITTKEIMDSESRFEWGNRIEQFVNGYFHSNSRRIEEFESWLISFNDE